MKVHQLIKALQELNPGAEVRLATQRHWPFEYTIAGVVINDELTQPGRVSDDELADADESEDDLTDVVWIVEGDQIGYADSEIFKLV
jgi:hypothetical protein